MLLLLLRAMSTAQCKTAANLAAAIEAAHYDNDPRLMLTLLEETSAIEFSKVRLYRETRKLNFDYHRRCCGSLA